MRYLQMPQVQPTTPKRERHQHTRMLDGICQWTALDMVCTRSRNTTRGRCRTCVELDRLSSMAMSPQAEDQSVDSFELLHWPAREGRVPPLSTISPWPPDCPPVRFLTRLPHVATVPPALPQIPPLDLSRAQASVLPAPVRSFLLSHSRRLPSNRPSQKIRQTFRPHSFAERAPFPRLTPQTQGRRLQAGLPALRPPTPQPEGSPHSFNNLPSSQPAHPNIPWAPQ